MSHLPPPPLKDGSFPYVWQEWFRVLRNTIQSVASAIPWTSVSKSGSNLTDIVIRNHDNLQNTAGSGTYHLSSTEHGALTGSVTGAWSPTFTNLTVINGTGGATYVGRYTRLGRMVFWEVTITCTGTATTESSSGTTYHNLPISAVRDSCSLCANRTSNVAIGTGVLDSVNDRNYSPTWGATGNLIVLSGQYEG